MRTEGGNTLCKPGRASPSTRQAKARPGTSGFWLRNKQIYLSTNCPVCGFCYSTLIRLNPREGSVVARRTAPVEIVPYQQEGARKAREQGEGEATETEVMTPGRMARSTTSCRSQRWGHLGKWGGIGFFHYFHCGAALCCNLHPPPEAGCTV